MGKYRNCCSRHGEASLNPVTEITRQRLVKQFIKFKVDDFSEARRREDIPENWRYSPWRCIFADYITEP